MKEDLLKQLLESILGPGKSSRGARGEESAVFNCPSCNHRKKKLTVNLVTQQFQCWVCDFKGHRAFKLLKEAKASPKAYDILKSVDLEYKFKNKKQFKPDATTLQLPKGVEPIISSSAVLSRHALHYLTQRGITQQDIVKLGADVLACLESQPLRMTGIGDHLNLIDLWPRDGYIVLVNPRIPLATKEVFAALEQKNNNPMPSRLPIFSSFKELVHFVRRHRNDLEETAIKLEPIIKKVLLEICKNKNCLVSRMSGSGPTCFGLFENYSKAHSAKLRLMKDFPNWWVVSSKLTVDKSELSPFNLL